MIELPRSLFIGMPNLVKFGKTDVAGGASDYGTPGADGTCVLRDILIDHE